MKTTTIKAQYTYKYRKIMCMASVPPLQLFPHLASAQAPEHPQL